MSEADDDIVGLARSTTPEQRFLMMWRLAADAWALTGKPFPEYERKQMPGRLLSFDEA